MPARLKNTKINPEDLNIGVINPYALVEVMLKRRVNWKHVDARKLMERQLGMPYEKLFDAKFDSPLYAGLKYDPVKNVMVHAAVPKTASAAHRASVDVGATVWFDPGDFFEEAAEMTDPVQGAVGDCYFIAALASVVWARTYVIAQRTRAIGPNQQDFVDMIQFFATPGSQPKNIEVTEKLPLNSPGNTFIYARSSEVGEIWPAVYEKAYAKWRLNSPGDTPNIPGIAGGDPVAAASQLTGLNRYYYSNSSYTAEQIWQMVRANSISYKTFNPMVAWTFPSSPAGTNYATAHIVGNHAYSILGWGYANSQEYIILRNPWGTFESVLNVQGGIWTAWDAPYYGGPGFWRQISFATTDGIFGLRADTFKAYFAGFGVVK